MAFETINLGTQPAGTGGDTARSAFEKTNRNFLAVDVLSAAMSQAQFEAIRSQNKERYAASGWVSFGNHESGKQVNECKPGLYTALTTPNTLLIGKAGGVGGSKTDNASVHIDGVVFNLTNQFVLTLPSHPTSTQPERMDMYGVESEKVEISAASPNAYQGGLRGVGAAVNLFTATDQQKKDFFSANANTTYIGTDGKIYQWQLYKISFAGTTDGVPSPSEQGYSLNAFGDLWLKEGKNLLYFGNVLRLNDGGYHPSFNPLGAAKFVGDTFWYNTAASITSRADCFYPANLLAGSGSIASGKSGRPEIGGRYYDAIYASGFGGVCRDMRYPAYGITSEDSDEADQRVKNGAYRGFEKLVFSKVTKATAPSSSSQSQDIFVANASEWTGGDRISLYDGETGTLIFDKQIVTAVGDSFVYCQNAPQYNRVAGRDYYSVQEKYTNVSVGGSFLQTDVVGNPDTILVTQALVNGWHGSWIPLIPAATGIISEELIRKNLGSINVDTTYSLDFGSSFEKTTSDFSIVDNSVVIGQNSNLVSLLQYTAFAKQTENAVNASVYGGIGGLHDMAEYGGYFASIWGGIFFESLLNKVAISDAGGGGVSHLNLTIKLIRPDTFTMNPYSDQTCYHTAISKPSPTNGSSGIKALGYNVNISQQAFIQYAYTELKHNGANWGDDGKVTIVDNQSTKTDLNGNSVLVGTAKLREPIGWIKNKV